MNGKSRSYPTRWNLDIFAQPVVPRSTKPVRPAASGTDSLCKRDVGNSAEHGRCAGYKIILQSKDLGPLVSDLEFTTSQRGGGGACRRGGSGGQTPITESIGWIFFNFDTQNKNIYKRNIMGNYNSLSLFDDVIFGIYSLYYVPA